MKVKETGQNNFYMQKIFKNGAILQENLVNRVYTPHTKPYEATNKKHR